MRKIYFAIAESCSLFLFGKSVFLDRITDHSCSRSVFPKRLFSRKISLLLCVLMASMVVRAQVTVTPASGGTNISADKAANAIAPGYTILGDILIQETADGDFGTGVTQMVLNAPAGWTFNTNGVTATATGGDFTTGAITYSATTITIPLTVSTILNTDLLTISNVSVRATNGTALPGIGNVTATFTGTINNFTTTTNLGSLSQVVGNAAMLAFTTQPGNATYGAVIGTSIIETQDQFGTPSVTGLGATVNVTASIASGTGTLAGTTVQNIGTGGGNGTVSFSNLFATNAGAKTILVGALGFTAGTSASVTVNQALLTITATGIDKVYDGSTTATVTLADDRVTGDVLTIAYTAASFANANAGTGKAVSVTGITVTGTDAGNYTFNNIAATTADITAKVLTVTATGIDKVYDGNTTATATLADDRETGDVLIIAYTAASFANANVGTGKAVSVTGITVTGADAGNYTFNNTAATTADITAKVLTITATGIDKVYDGNTTATVTLADDRETGDVLTITYTAASFANANVGTGKAVSVTGITVTGADAGNYTFNNTAATTADITAKVLTITATGIDKVYDGNTTATVTLADDRVAGDILTTSYATATFADKNIGTGKAVSISGINISGADAGNYTFNNTASTTANITGKVLTITAAGINKVYDGTTSATVTLGDNRTAGDVFTLSYTAATFVNKNVGTGKAVSVTGITISGPDAGNYTFNNTASTTANITQRALLVTAVGINKVYDGNTSATVTLADNRVAGDVFTSSSATRTFVDKNVGIGKIITVSGITITGIDAGNYTFNSTASATANITAKALTVTADNKTKLFGTANPALTVSYSGFATGDNAASLTTQPSATTTAIVSSPVGTYSITAAGGVSGNYTFTYVSGSLTVTTATPSITVGSNNNPACFNSSITFTATITSSPNVTGQVQFFDGAISMGTVAVSGNSATFAISTLSASTHSITARYLGDANFNPITSSALSQPVNALPAATGAIMCQGGTGTLNSTAACATGSSASINEFPVTGTTGGGSGNAWINPTRVVADDNSYTTNSIAGVFGTNVSEPLNATNFGFTIPLTASILGIQVSVGRYASGSSLKDNSLRLIKGTPVGANRASGTNYTTSEVTANYGNATDLWGTTWTAAELNQSDFGVSLIIENGNFSSRTANVDYISVTVTYSIPGTLKWYTVSSGGTTIGSNSPFNPVGVTGSPLANTNSPGTTTFYAACEATPNCRTAVDFVINPLPTITGNNSAICIGETLQLIGSATPNVSAPWVSATPTVATVSNTGLVTGQNAGTSVITYKNSNGCIITTTVTVLQPIITGVLTVCQSATTLLSATGSTPAAVNPWVSSNPAVATISNTGLVAGLIAGTSIITYTNSIGCTATATVTVRPTPTAIISGTTTVCRNATAPQISFTNPQNLPVRITYNINGLATQTVDVGASATATVNAPTAAAGIFNYNLVSVAYQPASPGCSNPITGTATITVLPTPTTTISAATSVCKDGTPPLVTFTNPMSLPTTITYRIGTGTPATIDVAGNSTSTVSAPTGTAGTFNYNLLSVIYQGTPACNTTISGSAIITVNPLPTASISGDNTVCQAAATPNITFTGAVGTRPYTFTYNINGGSNLTAITSASSNSVTVPAPTSTPGTYIYNLMSVSDNRSCSQLQSGSATVTVNSTPAATISGTTTVCKDETAPTITFSNPMVLPVTVTYNINGLGTTTINVAANSSALITAPTSVAGIFNYNIVNVAYQSGPACLTPISGQTATVTVRPSPTATISGTTTVCQDATSSDITFTNPQALPVTITYNINSGAPLTINVAANSSTPVAAPTAAAGTFVYTLESVIYQAGIGCSNIITGEFETVTVRPLPLAIISGDIAVCQNQPGPTITFTNPMALNVTVTYNINGGSPLTVIVPANNTATVPSATNIAGTFVYNLVSVAYSTAPGCSNTISGSATVIVNPLPTATISGTIPVCHNNPEPLITFTGAGGTAPYTFTYKINGGPDVTVSTTSGNTVTVSAPTNITGIFTYSLVGVQDASLTTCSQLQTGSAVVTVFEPIAITVQPALTKTTCVTFPVSFSVTATGDGRTYQWYKVGNATPLADTSGVKSGTTSATLVITNAAMYDAGTYYVIVSGSSPCTSVQSNNSTLSVNRDIDITIPPVSVTQCAGTTATFTVTATGTGISYQWRRGTTHIPNDARISGANTATLTITDLVAGDIGTNYNVELTSPGGMCPQASSTNVSLNVTPLATVNVGPAMAPTCQGSTTQALGGSFGGSATGAEWTADFPGTFIDNSGSTPALTTYIVPANAPANIEFTLTATGSPCIGAVLAIKVMQVNQLPTVDIGLSIGAICQGGTSDPLGGAFGGSATSALWSDGGAGGTFTNNITGLTPGIVTYTAAANSPSIVTLRLTSTGGSCGPVFEEKTITVNPSAIVNAGAAVTPICQGGTTFPLGGSFSGGATGAQWSDGLTGPGAGTFSGSGVNPTYTASATAPAVVTLTLTSSGGFCGSAIASKLLTVNPLPNAGPAITAICQGGTTGDLGGTYGGAATGAVWSDGLPPATRGTFTDNGGTTPGTATYTAATNAPATITLTLTATGGPCGTVATSKQLTVNPTATVSPLTQSICNSGNIAPIEINGAVPGTITSWTRDNPAGITTTVLLNGSGTITGSFNNSTAASIPVTFTITTTAASGCVSVMTVVINVDATLISPVISATQILCIGASPVPLTGTLPTGGSSSGYTYQWQFSPNANHPWTSITGANSLIYTPPTTSRYYRLFVNNGCGSDTSNTVQISTASDFGLSISGNGPSTPLCSGSVFNFEIVASSLGSLGGGRNIRYYWQSQEPGFFTSPTVNPYGITSNFLFFYYYTGDANFTVNNITNAPVTKNLVVTPTILNSNGSTYCSLSPEIIPVTINPRPIIPNTSVNACSGELVTVTPANGIPTAATVVPIGTRYNWPMPAVIPAGITGATAGSATTLTSFTQTLTNTTNTPITVNYIVTPRYNGTPSCLGTPFTIAVTVNPKPVIPIQNITTCENTPFTVTPVNSGATIVPAGTTYSWSTPVVTGGITGGAGGTGSSITGTLINPSTTTQTATYTVSPTSGTCQGADFSVVITVNPTATANISAILGTICSGAGTSITFTGTPNTTVTYTVGIAGANQTIPLDGTGSASLSTGNLTATTSYYLVSVAYPAAPTCSQPLTGSVSVNVNGTATATVSASPTTLCQGQTSTVTFSGTPNIVVTYNTGGADQTITLDGAGTAAISDPVSATITYSLVSVGYPGTPNCLQPLTGNATITVSPNANAGIVTGASPICIGQTATLVSDGDAGGAWSSTNSAVATVNATTGLVTAISAGTTDITYTVSTGCNSPVSSFQTLTVSPDANAGTISGISPLCVGAQVTYTSIGGDAGGVWSSSNTGVATVDPDFGTVTAVGLGTADIIYTLTAGCNLPASSFKTVSITSPATPATPGAISGPTIVCASSSGFVYSVVNDLTASSYVWTLPVGLTITNGATTNSITVSTSAGFTGGDISVLAANTCGFSAPTLPLTITSYPVGQWLGVNTEWNDGQNWCSGTPPNATINVTIPSTPNDPLISTAVAQVNDITIALNASVTVTNETLKIAGDIINNGVFDVTQGTLEFMGTAFSQTLEGGWLKDSTLENLKMSNPDGLEISSNSKLKITGVVSFGNVSNTAMITGDSMILVSNSTGTARIADVTNNGANSGNKFEDFNGGAVTVERYFPARRAWRLFTGPVAKGGEVFDNWQLGNTYLQGRGTYVSGAGATNPTGANGLDWSPFNNSSLKVGSGLTPILNTHLAKVSWNLADTSDNIGYFIFVRGDRLPANTNPALSNNTTLSSKGQLQTGRQTFPATTAHGGFTLIGNPYASTVNFNKLKRSSLTKRFWVWDPYLNSDQGGYVVVDDYDDDSVYVMTPPSPGKMNEIIQSGQAFFVETDSSNQAPFLMFEESAKSDTGINLKAFRPLSGLKQSLRTNLYYMDASKNSLLLDGVYAQFDNRFNKIVDKQDALKFGNVKEMIAWQRDNKNLSIERRPLIVSDDTLYLRLTKTTPQSYRFEFEPLNLDPLLTVVLEDSYTNKKTALSINAKSVHDFVINSDPESGVADRFRIVFKQVVTAPLPVTYTRINAYQQVNDISVDWTVENEINTSKYEVEKSIDASNFTKVNTTIATGTNSSTTDYKWLDKNPVNGNNYYRIRSVSLDGKFEYSKTVVVNISKGSSGIRIYPNPVTEGIIGAEFKNMAGGIYKTRLLNSLGQTILVKQVNHAGGTSMEYIKPDYKLLSGIYQLEVTAPDKTITTIKVIVK